MTSKQLYAEWTIRIHLTGDEPAGLEDALDQLGRTLEYQARTAVEGLTGVTAEVEEG